MTMKTNRNNIKTVFWLVTGMVVFSCFAWAEGACVFGGFKDCSVLNCFADCASGTQFVWVSVAVMCFLQHTFFAFIVPALVNFITCFECFILCILFAFNPALNALVISCGDKSPFFRVGQLPIASFFNATWFAFIITPIEFRMRLIFVARRALFCYTWFRHGFFLVKKLCLEPSADLFCVWLVSLYYINAAQQGKNNNFVRIF